MVRPVASVSYDFSGQSVLVTGAARGIGRGVARAFIAAGASTMLADVIENDMSEFAAAGERARSVECDIADERSVAALVDSAVAAFGALDILVHCAAIIPYRPLGEVTVDEWDRAHAINTRGSFLCIRESARVMRGQGSGAIVTIASLASVRPYTGLPAYCSSKAGALLLAQTAALELADANIRVNAILPGGTLTEGAIANFPSREAAEAATSHRVPLGRCGTPEDMAQAALFLASPAASFITGHALVVDGGYVLS